MRANQIVKASFIYRRYLRKWEGVRRLGFEKEPAAFNGWYVVFSYQTSMWIASYPAKDAYFMVLYSLGGDPHSEVCLFNPHLCFWLSRGGLPWGEVLFQTKHLLSKDAILLQLMKIEVT